MNCKRCGDPLDHYEIAAKKEYCRGCQFHDTNKLVTNVVCPSCGWIFWAFKRNLGKKGECPRCFTKIEHLGYIEEPVVGAVA